MRNDLIYGACMGVGAIVGLTIYGQSAYVTFLIFTGIGVAALIIYIKNKKNRL